METLIAVIVILWVGNMATQAPAAPSFIDTFKQRFPEYATLTPETIATNITKSLSGKGSSAFLNTFKQRFPEYSKLSNTKIISNLQSSIQGAKNKGDLASGDQAADLGLSIDDPKNYIGGKTTKSISDFFTGATKKFAEMIGTSIAAPENVQKYSDALQIHNEVTQNLTKAIGQKKKLGQDTSTLEKALKQQVGDTPQISDFVDQTTLKRIQQTGAQNLEEALGLGTGTLLNILAAPGAGAATDAVADTATSIGSKVATGAKIGAGFGAAGGAADAASKTEDAGGVVKETAEGGAEGAVIGGGTELAGGAVVNKLNDRPAFGSLAKAPAKLQGEEGALLNVNDAKQTITDAQSQIKSAIKNPDIAAPAKTLGSTLLSKILTKAGVQLDEIGTKMGTAIKQFATTPVDLTKNTSDFEGELKNRVPVTTGPDRTMLQNFRSDLAKITGGGDTIPTSDGKGLRVGGNGNPGTLEDVDNFLRKWQKVDVSKAMQNNSVGALIDSTIHDINETVKNVADKAETDAGVEGHPYRESNDEYSRLIENVSDAKKEAGTQRKYTGIYDNANAIIKGASNPSTASEAWRNLANQTGEPLAQPASLIHAVEQIYNGEKPDDILKTLQVGFSLKMTAVRTLKNVLLKSEGDPDAIVQKMIQYIEDNSASKK